MQAQLGCAVTVEGTYMFKLIKYTAMVAVAVCSLHARADLVIDTFQTAQIARDESAGLGDVSDGAVVSADVALPALQTGLSTPVFRTLSADKFGQNSTNPSPPDPGSGVQVSVNTGTQRLAFSQDADQWGQGRVIWAGQVAGGTGSSILDLTTVDPASSFFFTYRSDGPLQVNITVWDTTGVSTTTNFNTVDTNGAFLNENIALADFDFSGFASTDIGKIEILFNVNATSATADIDLTLTQIRNSIPEPATIALIGMALLGASFRRRSVK